MIWTLQRPTLKKLSAWSLILPKHGITWAQHSSNIAIRLARDEKDRESIAKFREAVDSKKKSKALMDKNIWYVYKEPEQEMSARRRRSAEGRRRIISQWKNASFCAEKFTCNKLLDSVSRRGRCRTSCNSSVFIFRCVIFIGRCPPFLLISFLVISNEVRNLALITSATSSWVARMTFRLLAAL